MTRSCGISDGSQRCGPRSCATSNPCTPVESLAAPALDPDARTRGGAANAVTPTPLLRDLAADSSPWARRCAETNRSVNPDVLAALAADADEAVREAVCENPSTSSQVLRVLTTDKAFTVQRRASEARDGCRSPTSQKRHRTL